MKQQQIKGYPDYTIDSDGIVTSNRTSNSKVLKGGVHKGCLRVALTNAEGSKYFRVKRLVADAFIPNPNDLPSVINIDSDPTNNSIENLERATVSEVNSKGWVNTRGTNDHLFKLLRLMHIQGFTYSEAGDAFCLSGSTVCEILKRGGYAGKPNYNVLYPKVKAMMREGFTMTEIAFRVGCNEKNLDNMVLRKGKNKKREHKHSHLLSQMLDLRAQGLSDVKISKRLGISGSSVGRTIKRSM